jgi:hypothetical protein
MLCGLLAWFVLPALRDAIGAQRAATEPRLEGPRARALLLISRDVADALVATTKASERLFGEGSVAREAYAELGRRVSDAGMTDGLDAMKTIG